MPGDVYADVSTTWYTSVAGAGDGARGRSQVAWTIASAIAGALVTAGLIQNFAQSNDWVISVGIGAVVGWLVTAVVFMWAVITPLPSGPLQAEGSTTEEAKLNFVTKALDWYREDLGNVQSRQRWAVRATSLAVLVTGAAIGASLLVAKPVDRMSATVAFNSNGQAIIKSLCGSGEKTLSGSLTVDSLQQTDIVLTVSKTACKLGAVRRSDKQVELLIPSKDVSGVASGKPQT